jgi:hypothetical protein
MIRRRGCGVESQREAVLRVRNFDPRSVAYPLLREERALLARSFAALLAAVHR